jgi:hypothetical protein
MSTDPAADVSDSPGPGGATEGPSEAELRAAYEAELSRITPADMMLQAAVSLLNLGARRLGLTGGPDGGEAGAAGAEADAGRPGGSEPERDLGQVRDAIDGVRALLAILERSMPQELRPLRDALSQLQIAYAREAPAGAQADRPADDAPPAAAKTGATAEEREGAPGPAQSSGRLWVPGS